LLKIKLSERFLTIKKNEPKLLNRIPIEKLASVLRMNAPTKEELIPSIETVYSNLFCNLRVFKRFYNFFVLDYSLKESHVDATDFINVSVLKFFYFEEYKALTITYVSYIEEERSGGIPLNYENIGHGILKLMKEQNLSYTIPANVESILKEIFISKIKCDEGKSLIHYLNHPHYFYDNKKDDVLLN
jgi:hypothetical protein